MLSGSKDATQAHQSPQAISTAKRLPSISANIRLLRIPSIRQSVAQSDTQQQGSKPRCFLEPARLCRQFLTCQECPLESRTEPQGSCCPTTIQQPCPPSRLRQWMSTSKPQISGDTCTWLIKCDPSSLEV